jgi:riboflavin kinase/FMN adenylyltransferase
MTKLPGMTAKRHVLSLGNFDGPHLGHAEIIRRARALADAEGAAVAAVTFDPSPIRLLRPGQEPPQIATVAERVDQLRVWGCDRVEVVEPTPDLLRQDAESFVADLVQRYRPIAIVEGPDFRFGHQRRGDMQLLEDLGDRHGFRAITVPRVSAVLHNLQQVPVSSSMVRWLVGRGRVADAAACLGRRFALAGPIVQGEQRGRQIQVPTANLDGAALRGRIVPADGVYAGSASWRQAGRKLDKPAAISVGHKPTFGRKTLTVEAHLLDFAGDLYGRNIRLDFVRWLRGQHPFPGIEALREQLQRDIAATREYIHDSAASGASL